MGFSREARILTLLAIDTCFFFLEIIVGYAVGSLALVADSFHMLNDVMSLVVALYAVKLSKKESGSDPRYSYGWQRAEILGALVNGVFLLALCFSIFMEAIERFVNVTEVKNPKLVIIVGSLGLASNIVGLFLFHDHGHSHGGHSHSHGGHDHSHSHGVEDGHAHGDEHSHGTHSHDSSAPQQIPGANRSVPSTNSDPNLSTSHNSTRAHVRKDSSSSLFGHPAQTRAYVVQTAHDMGFERPAKSTTTSSASERDRLVSRDSAASSSASGNSSHNGYGSTGERDVESGLKNKKKRGSLLGHNHGIPEENEDDRDDLPSVETALAHRLSGANGKPSTVGDGHSHSHGHGHGHGHAGHEGEMNMRGVFLHVLGDALGNVGVIAAGLFILLTHYSWRFYTDPLISFVITIIIFHSALPLVKSASFILLQGVPAGVPLEVVREAMQNVEGVLSVHELHIWQLSEAKIVASVHVLVDCSAGQEQKYMDIAAELRQLLHAWGIHSSTIQPEFVQGGIKEAARISGVDVAEEATDEQGRLVTKDGRLVERELSRVSSNCLLACEDASCAEASCCPPPAPSSSSGSGSGLGRSSGAQPSTNQTHSDDHGHDGDDDDHEHGRGGGGHDHSH